MIMLQKKILIIICFALCLLIPGVYANVVSVTPASAQHQIGETQSYNVILDSAPDGLSGFNITITVQNPSVAQITRVSFPAWANPKSNSTIPSTSVWCKAVDLNGDSGTANISLCTILVRADNYGTTNITIIPERIEDRSGGRYTPSVVPATLTVTGGLTFAGGPWNNYVMHSIATMAELLRGNPGSRGLITANGGYLTKHSFGVYSATPPAAAFRWEDVQAEVDREPTRTALVEWEGTGTVESWTTPLPCVINMFQTPGSRSSQMPV